MTSEDHAASAKEPAEPGFAAHSSLTGFDWLAFIRRRWMLIAGVLLLAVGISLPFLADSAAQRSDRAAARAEDSIRAGHDDAALPLLGEALRLNPQNPAAQSMLAGIYLRTGKQDQARALYEALVARDPADIDGLVALASIGLQGGDADMARRNASTVLAIDPRNADARAILALLQIEDAVGAQDSAALDAAAAEAQTALQAAPDNLTALRAVIRAELAGTSPIGALPFIDHAIALAGHTYELDEARLTALQKSGQSDAAITQLEEMYHRFPQNPDLGDQILAIYDQRGDYPAARTLLFDRALKSGFGQAQTDALLDHARTRGPAGDERALLDQIIAQAPDTATAARYTMTAAALDNAEGHPDAATAALQGLLGKFPDGEISIEAHTELARVELSQGRVAEASAIVDQILSAHPSTMAALKLRARIDIDAGNMARALTALQTAVDQDPRDSEVMMMMGEAYDKSNALALAGERFALAVEYSGNGVQESLASAAFLARTGRVPAAVEVMTRAIATHPGSVELLGAAAGIYTRQLDWVRAQSMTDALLAIGTPEATAAAGAAGRAIAEAQAELDTVREIIDLVVAGPPGPTPDAARSAARLLDLGDPEGGLAYMLDPARGNDPAILTIRATLYALNGQGDEAEIQLRAILGTNPSDSLAFLALYHRLQQSGRADVAASLLEQSLAQPQPPIAALLAAASNSAEAGDTAAAIALTETAYQRNPQDEEIAALLARRIALDPAASPDALRHARDLAAPLRSLARPLVLDTLGWIGVRLGNPGSGLVDLQSAGRILPDEPIIRFHRGVALYGLGRTAEARDELQTYLALDITKPVADVAEARATLDKIDAAQ